MNALALLEQRGLLAQVSDDAALRTLFETPGQSIYVGFDPTADSLHVGHLLPIMALAHLQRAGHRPIALVGGATGMIGDPSGRSDERSLLTPEQVTRNSAGLRQQLRQFLNFDGERGALMVDNSDWIRPLSIIDWLRDVGKEFPIGYMMGKESVRRRLDDREQGLTYTEFSYMLLQAYDFLHLLDHEGCRVQGGGNDQWGNITAGIELVRRKRAETVFGMTFPLVSTASGEKFGKSAGNAVWLDPERTSPYQFYQFWMQTDDRDVGAYLRYFTFRSVPEIEGIERAHAEHPGRRHAQRLLAESVTAIVHGQEAVRRAQRASALLFGEPLEDLTDEDLDSIRQDVPSTARPRTELEHGLSLVSLLTDVDAAESAGAARRLIRGGGVYVNNKRVTDEEALLGKSDLASESMLLLRTGKKRYFLIQFNERGDS